MTPSIRVRDEGAASVLVVGLVAVIATVMVAVLIFAGAVLASHRARLAVDLAALAGAVRLQSGTSTGEACGIAAQVAHRNRARLLTCRASGTVLEVTAAVPAWSGSEAIARSRAGPDAFSGPGKGLGLSSSEHRPR